MKHFLSIVFIFLLTPNFFYGQIEIDKSLISSSFQIYESEDVLILSSMGEVLISPFGNVDAEIFQGFLQPIETYSENLESPEILNLKLYPSPTNSYLHISGISDTYEADGMPIRIFDIRGRLIKEHINETIPERIEIQSLKPGLYFLKIMTNERLYNASFVKI